MQGRTFYMGHRKEVTRRPVGANICFLKRFGLPRVIRGKYSARKYKGPRRGFNFAHSWTASQSGRSLDKKGSGRVGCTERRKSRGGGPGDSFKSAASSKHSERAAGVRQHFFSRKFLESHSDSNACAWRVQIVLNIMAASFFFFFHTRSSPHLTRAAHTAAHEESSKCWKLFQNTPATISVTIWNILVWLSPKDTASF